MRDAPPMGVSFKAAIVPAPQRGTNLRDPRRIRRGFVHDRWTKGRPLDGTRRRRMARDARVTLPAPGREAQPPAKAIVDQQRGQTATRDWPLRNGDGGTASGILSEARHSGEPRV